jgi:hypothetical protein
MSENRALKADRSAPELLKQFRDQVHNLITSELNVWGAGEVANHAPDYSEQLIHFYLRANRKDVPRPDHYKNRN